MFDYRQYEKLKNLTLVVPTYYRQNYALRLMNYWSGKGPNVIVLDGTNTPIDNDKISNLKNISYHNLNSGFYERINKSLEMVNTRYVMLAGDDEFYLPSALIKCMNELDKNKELVACCGCSIGFFPEKKYVRGIDVYMELIGYEINSSNPFERIKKHMSNYAVNQIYAVCRASDWIKIFKGITNNREFSVFAIAEYQFEMCMSYAGKSKVLNELMWLRNMGENEPIRGTDPSLCPILFEEWYANYKKNSNEINELIAITASIFISLSNDMSRKYAMEIAKVGFDYFSEWNKNRKNKNLRIFNFFLNIITIMKIIPKSPIKKIYSKLKTLYYRINTKDEILSMASKMKTKNQINYDCEELNAIIKIIELNK